MIMEQHVGEGVAEVNVEDVSTASVAAEGVASIADDEVPAADKIAQALEITKLKQRVKKLKKRNKLKASMLRRLKKGRIITDMDADKDVTLKDVAAVAKDVQDAKIEEKPFELQEVVEVVTTAKLIIEVVTTTSATITAATPQLTTDAASTLTTASSTARRRKRVVIRDPEETTTASTTIHSEAKSKDKGKLIMAELNKNIDWDEVIDHVQRKEKEDNTVKRYQALKRKPHTEAQARKNMMIYLRNVAGFKMDYFKGMTYDDIHLMFKKKFNSNVAFLQKTKEQMDEEDSRALKRLSETQEEKAAKKQKLDEEVAELKRHFQIMPNGEDDVYTKATPLAWNVPVVDYEIYTENNKPYYKIIKADGSLQLFLSFLSLLRNFDREDLEVLWELVKEREAISTFKVHSESTDQHYLQESKDPYKFLGVVAKFLSVGCKVYNLETKHEVSRRYHEALVAKGDDGGACGLLCDVMVALITLTKRVKKLEKKLKHKRRRAVVDSSENEEASLDKDDSPKQESMIEEIDEDENVNLVKSTKDKGKAIMQESEPPKKIKKKQIIQISLDEESAQRFYEEEQSQLLMDEEYSQQVQAQWEEKESVSIEERSRLLTEFIDHKKNKLDAKRTDEKTNKPPTQAQQRIYMSNYIKNMEGYTLKQLKKYSFEEIKILFDRTIESIRKFVLMKSKGQIAYSKAGEGSSKEGESLKRPAKKELRHEQ
uniref:Uncharacterized protein n=1 Tax=Tanacetum cinerariifolium TaxID=118510 RepID=A0A6L2LPP9_TANCI|nr:hypothetical protein [Tanacetum cinerariifolium]